MKGTVMRGMVIICLAVVAVSMLRGHSHFTPKPSAPMPAVNIP